MSRVCVERALPPAAFDFWPDADPHAVLEGVIPTGAASQAKRDLASSALAPDSHFELLNSGVILSGAVFQAKRRISRGALMLLTVILNC